MWRSTAQSLLRRARFPSTSRTLTNPPVPFPRLFSSDSTASTVRSTGFGDDAGENSTSLAGSVEKCSFSGKDKVLGGKDEDLEKGEIFGGDSSLSGISDGEKPESFSDSGKGEGLGEKWSFRNEVSDAFPVKDEVFGGEEGLEKDEVFREEKASSDAVKVKGAEVDVEELRSVRRVLNGAVEENLEPKLDELDLVINTEFAIRVLKTKGLPRDRLIGFFRWAFKRSDVVKRSGVVDLLVQEVCGSIEVGRNEVLMLWDFVKEIGESEKGLVNVSVLNQLISVFSNLRKAKNVMETFNKFDDFGCVPDGETYYLTIHALGKRTWADVASAVCEKMLSSRAFPDDENTGKIIKFFCKGDKAKYAHSIYLAAKENGKSPPASYVNFLIEHLSRSDDGVTNAIELLEECSEESQSSMVGPFTSVISGLCRIKDTNKARQLLDQMLSSGPSPGKAVFNYVITALAKAGDLEDAVALLRVMETRNLRPDIRAYNVIMSGYAKGGSMDEARKIFLEAKKVHPKLGRVSYHILTQGYCRIEEFDNALKCMTEMKEEGIVPNVDEYRKLVQSLCLKAFDWRTAEKLVEEMKENGLQLDGNTCGLVAATKQLEEEEMHSAGVTSKT